MTNAEYKTQIVADYRNNPLIEALPHIWNTDEAADMLSHNEGQHDGERQLGAHHRMHCVQRLFRYFQPLEQHISIERQLSICIRQGYLHRNPITREYSAALADGHKAIVCGGEIEKLSAFRPTSAGFRIIGLSGIGKTTAVENILALYPQVIEHSRYKETPLVLRQLVWLKLDCPHDGSLKGLCLSFFEAVDRTIGTNYYESYSGRGNTIDLLMIRMTQVARLHCLGVLVIDEIQHLSLAKGGGSEKMLNFFVTLVNTIGIPVVLIGTNKAMKLFQSEFRQARRSSGQGDLFWDKMKNDAAWDIFVSSMWINQWTRHIVPLTKEFKDALYYESQGITDIAVKLYTMIQIRAIGSLVDTFTPKDFHTVALEKLGMVQNALDALRSGDKKRIDAISDIAPIDVSDYYTAYLAMLPPPKPEYAPVKRETISLSERAVLKLLELDVEPPDAKRLVGKVMATHLELRKVGEIVRVAYKAYLAAQDNIGDDTGEDGDLRNFDNYDEMTTAGIIAAQEW